MSGSIVPTLAAAGTYALVRRFYGRRKSRNAGKAQSPNHFPLLISCVTGHLYNVGPVKHFLKTLLSFHLKEFFSFVFFVFFFSLHRRPRLVCNLSAGFSPT